MKILITTHHLNFVAGSELITVALAEELGKMRHEVFIFSPCLGSIFDQRLKKGKIRATADLLDFQKERFDVIHAQHNTTAIIARAVFPETPIVFMTHGKIPELEQPPSIDLGISRFIVVCESGIERLTKEYGIARERIHVVRNFIDTEKFKAKSPVAKKLKKLLVISHHYTDEVRKVVEGACREEKIAVGHIGAPENPVENVEDWINQADMVVTIGRGAMEAMACERNLIVYDMFGADGFIDEKEFFESRKNNFSGLRRQKKFSKNDFKAELAKYDPAMGEKLRALILKENSAPLQVGKLVEIYAAAAKEKVTNCQIQKGQLFREMVFLENESRNNSFLHSRIVGLEESLQQKNREIGMMKSSKFWRLRDMYLKLKSAVNLLKF